VATISCVNGTNLQKNPCDLDDPTTERPVLARSVVFENNLSALIITSCGLSLVGKTKKTATIENLISPDWLIVVMTDKPPYHEAKSQPNRITSVALLAFDLPKPPRATEGLDMLRKEGLVKCLTPELPGGQPGRVYGLTRKGRQLQRQLAKDDGLSVRYYQPRLDWRSYGWVACGGQRRPVIRALSKELMRPKQILQHTKHHYQPGTQSSLGQSLGISRQNLNDILQQVVARGIVVKEKETSNKRGRDLMKYRLTNTGEKIKQLLVGKDSDSPQHTAG